MALTWVVAMAAVLVFAPPAMAAAHAAHGNTDFSLHIPFGLFGISISGILKTLAKDLFNVLAGALLPDWLKHAPQNALRWLIALPDPADPVQWPTIGHLERDTTAVAVAFLPVTLAVATARYTASGVTGGVHHPAESLVRLVTAAAGLLLFPWGFRNAVAAVNVTTTALLSFAGIDHGLQRALALMFAGGVAFGVTGPLVALLVIAAIFLAAGLFIIKVGVLALFAILFVAGPLALAGYPIPELHGAWRLLMGLVVAAAMIPIGWCVIFAVAGAISADITHIGTPAAIGTRLVGFFAGILTFFIAFRWPFFLIGLVRARGLLSSEGIGSGGGGGTTTGARGLALARARDARTALMAGAGTAGSAMSHVGGALGMPAGGLARGTARLAGRQLQNATATPLMLRGRQSLATSWQSVRERARASAVGGSRTARRVGRAGAVAAATPAAVTASVREQGSLRTRRAAGGAILENVRSTGTSSGRASRSSGALGTYARQRSARPAGTGEAGAATAPTGAPATRSHGSSGSARQSLSGAAHAEVRPAAAGAARSGTPTPDGPARDRASDRVSASATQRPLTAAHPRPRQPRKRRPIRPKPPSSGESK